MKLVLSIAVIAVLLCLCQASGEIFAESKLSTLEAKDLRRIFPKFFALQGATCHSNYQPVDTHGMASFARQQVLDTLPSQYKVDGAIILMIGGKEQTRSNSDAGILFRQDSSFWYISGSDLSDCAFAMDVTTGKSILFVPKYDSRHIIYNGDLPPFEEIIAQTAVDEVKYLSELENTIRGEFKTKAIYTVDKSVLLKDFPYLDDLSITDSFLLDVIFKARTVKSEAEVGLLRAASLISGQAHNAIMSATKPGLYESDLESLFLHECYNCGLRFQGYVPIVGAGVHASVLHYIDNSDVISDGQIVLVDSGGEYFGYTTDITRTYPANGKFTQQQRDIYNIVLDAQEAAMAASKPGQPYAVLTNIAKRALAAGLLRVGIFAKNATVDQIVNLGAIGTFFPHGLGHPVGLDVHDPYPSDMVLRTNALWTIEPGIYFVQGLVDEAKQGSLAHLYNFAEIEKYMDFGGVRIEDVILVTEDSYENVSNNMPRTVEEIEAFMAGAPVGPHITY
eukprot:TRINITY_DN18469_c0_g1::TRINITY_DN18469_c0_g1_i1::g.2787::m.2787 TRINITY_DN18469_c0_g1::TRINITY_DN18469_c0_g1_i1::g.2787  ORF type:complete len:517 (-),score=164.48,sp/P12955/PEPD_HUMAN/36.75/3e-81,Peptidase_M24/PF00557.19/1.6e-54,AMP_N/PF05195.11/3.8e-24,AMP_N/PF05195.11/1.5e+03 TRINITY_DN18469_c0_g1_i1:396-1913(-)